MAAVRTGIVYFEQPVGLGSVLCRGVLSYSFGNSCCLRDGVIGVYTQTARLQCCIVSLAQKNKGGGSPGWDRGGTGVTMLASRGNSVEYSEALGECVLGVAAPLQWAWPLSKRYHCHAQAHAGCWPPSLGPASCKDLHCPIFWGRGDEPVWQQCDKLRS